jgi:hypothetical protein
MVAKRRTEAEKVPASSRSTAGDFGFIFDEGVDMKAKFGQALMVAALAGAAVSVAQAQSITTLFNQNNSGSAGGANYFQIVVGSSPITITSIEINTLAAAGTIVPCRVYTAANTHAGNEANPGAWTLQAEGTGTSAGTNTPTPITLGSSIVLAANTSYGIAVTLSATSGTPAAASLAYSGTGTNPAPGVNQYSNGDLTLNLGTATNVLFSGTPFNPRIWNGTINYTIGGVTGACCLPSGACVTTTSSNCTAQSGTYQGDGILCVNVSCPQPPTGACCLFSGACSVVTAAACTAQGGTYQGNSTVCGTCPGVPPVFFSNCNISTGATTLSGVAAPAGGVWSETARDETDPTTANTTAGFGGTGALRLADDFVVPAGGMNVAYVRGYAYLTGATTTGVTAATLQIWNGPPNAGGTVIFGDTTTNRLANNSFSNIYRCFNTVTPPTCGGATTIPDQTRRLQYVYMTVNQFLPAGTYWIDFNYTGASFSPPSVQADAIGRQCDPNNSNGLQFNAAWVPLADAGQGCVPTPVNQDLFFDVLGTAPSTGPVCYANCDNSTVQPCLNVGDFSCFLNSFASGASYANCDNSTTPPVLNVGDFACFLNAFASGCSSCV